VLDILKTHTLIPAAAAMLLALGGLTACGQKGPLYMPKKPAGIATGQPAQTKPTQPETPAPAKQTPPVEGSGS